MDMVRSHGISRAHFEEGELVYEEGNLARNFYTILSGQVQVTRLENGVETIVATLGTGEYFGEVSLLQGLRHSASVRAMSPADLLVMSGADFKALANSSTYFGETLAEGMRRRLSGGAAENSPGPDHGDGSAPENSDRSLDG